MTDDLKPISFIYVCLRVRLYLIFVNRIIVFKVRRICFRVATLCYAIQNPFFSTHILFGLEYIKWCDFQVFVFVVCVCVCVCSGQEMNLKFSTCEKGCVCFSYMKNKEEEKMQKHHWKYAFYGKLRWFKPFLHRPEEKLSTRCLIIITGKTPLLV